MDQKAPYKRRIYLVKKGFQFRYMFSVLIIMLLASTIVGWTIYYSIWNKVGNTSEEFRFEEVSDIFRQVNISLLKMLPVLGILVAMFALMLSHKIAGPVYRFEVSAKQIANGDLGLRIKLRKGDELTDLADLFNKMTHNLEAVVKKDREVIEKIIGVINKIPMSLKQDEISKEEKEEIIVELTEIVSELKEVTYSFKIVDNPVINKSISEDINEDEVIS
ncbi:MAG: methyl-accepting chemotaxis protein [Candidatus Muirbacterium halophilum]|nr:methyl-accepting chemotaxis protein [Candidatus Muirbacterium halophilum]MCK9475358.1 methyl-accepting chemotaxis protein [Candidatus Muirbacterium halophilum]